MWCDTTKQKGLSHFNHLFARTLERLLQAVQSNILWHHMIQTITSSVYNVGNKRKSSLRLSKENAPTKKKKQKTMF